MERIGERVMWKLVSVRLEIALILTQIGACFAPSTTGSEISLDTPDGTLK
jgi:hypothetical protein